jgi:hypothetical protein
MEVAIYCPKCRWTPDAFSLWECLPVCAHQWNTFSTGGMCPMCGEGFEQTQCLSCGEFSPHRDWYHPVGDTGHDLEVETETDAPQKIEI